MSNYIILVCVINILMKTLQMNMNCKYDKTTTACTINCKKVQITLTIGIIYNYVTAPSKILD